MTPAARWEIPRKVWFVLLSWGLAVLVLAVLQQWQFQRQFERNQQEQARQVAEAKLQQDLAMCQMIDLFISGPAPVAGPAGDRGRVVIRAMSAYQATLHCDNLRPPPGVTR